MLPGVIFTFLVIVVPLLLLDTHFLINLGGVGVVGFLVFALTIGYVLDVIGIYRFNSDYQQTKMRFYDWINKLKPSVLQETLCWLKENRPEQKEKPRIETATIRAGEIILNYVWTRDEERHSRIESSRAKWVLALETSFSFMLSFGYWVLVFILGLSLHFGPRVDLFGRSVFVGLNLPSQYLFVAAIAVATFVLWRVAMRRGFDWQFNQNEHAIFLISESIKEKFPEGIPDTHVLIKSYYKYKKPSIA